MTLHRKFKALVRDLDKTALAELNRLVTAEMGRHGGISIDDIHPRMTPADKERALIEIGRILKEQP